MKKQFLVIVGLSSVIFSSCTETIPVVDTASVVVLQDTTYVGSVPAAEARRVLIEESTGVKCTNCPDGAVVLQSIDSMYHDQIVVVSEHAGKLTDPISGHSKDTFQNANALLLLTNYFPGEPDKPTAAFDRIDLQASSGDPYFEYRSKWPYLVEQRVSVATSLNLSVSSEYVSDLDEFVVTITGTYTSSVAKLQSLTIVSIEDSIIDAQDYPTYVDDNYVHRHVLREFISDYTGDALLSDVATKEAGRTFIKSFIYKIPDDKKDVWNTKKMKIVAFVHNNEIGDKEVQQAAEGDLNP